MYKPRVLRKLFCIAEDLTAWRTLGLPSKSGRLMAPVGSLPRSIDKTALHFTK